MSDLFRGRILRRLFSDLNVIPIERNGPDRAALRIAVGDSRKGGLSEFSRREVSAMAPPP